MLQENKIKKIYVHWYWLTNTYVCMQYGNGDLFCIVHHHAYDNNNYKMLNYPVAYVYR